MTCDGRSRDIVKNAGGCTPLTLCRGVSLFLMFRLVDNKKKKILKMVPEGKRNL